MKWNVKVSYPLKQGLKQLGGIKMNNYNQGVKVSYPLKQGLKHIKPVYYFLTIWLK